MPSQLTENIKKKRTVRSTIKNLSTRTKRFLTRTKRFLTSPDTQTKLWNSMWLLAFGFVIFLILDFFYKTIPDSKITNIISATQSSLPPNFIAAVAVYWVLDESIKQLYSVTELPDLPLRDFVNDIRSANQIRILETFTKLATEAHYNKFSEAVKEALNSGADIQILLVHPESEGADQRAAQLSTEETLQQQATGEQTPQEKQRLKRLKEEEEQRSKRLKEEILKQIRLTIVNFNKLRTDLGRESQLQIKLYKTSPIIALHKWDYDAYLSFYPLRARSDEAPNLKISTATTFGRYAERKFEELWKHSETIHLKLYMELEVKGETLYYVREGDVPICTSPSCESLYVLPKSLTEPLRGHFEQQDNIHISVEGGNDYLVSCSRLGMGGGDGSVRAHIIEKFRKKYCGDNGGESNIVVSDEAIIYKFSPQTAR
jgi:hypothetical protein